MKLKFAAHVIACAITATMSQAQDLRMVGAFPEGFVYTEEMAKPFIDLVTEETGGDINISYFGPDSVSPLEQLEPVQAGVFDLVFTHPAYHAGVTTLGLAIDAIATDPVARRSAGIIDALDTHYQTLGLKLITAPIAGTKGFRFYLNDPISGTPGLDGRKLRGTVSYQPMIEKLGGSIVAVPGAEVYSSMQKSVIDGTAWTLVGAYDFKWYEVAGYMSEPSFGQVGTMILMNLDSYNSLSDEAKQALDRVAANLESSSIARFDALAEQEEVNLLDKGVQITAFGDAEAAELENLWSDGVWKIALSGQPEAAAQLRKLGQEAGLTK